MIDMNDAKLTTLAQIREFLDGTEEVTFSMSVTERYDFIARTLGRFGYAMHGRSDKGVLLRYIERMTRLSRQQMTRLVKRYQDKGVLQKKKRAPKCGFKRTFRSGHQEVDGACNSAFRRFSLRAPCQYFHFPSLQSARAHIGNCSSRLSW